MTNYVRLRFRQAGKSTPKTCWAIKLGTRSYRQVNEEGEWGTNGVTTLIVLAEFDLVWEKEAKIDLKYGTLKTINPDI